MTDLFERASRLPTGQREAFMVWARRNLIRLETVRKYPTAGALAQALDPSTVQTADLRVIDEQLEWAFRTPGARLMISKPSQTGKSERALWGILRALLLDPDRRTIIVTHSEDLARIHSERLRLLLRTYGSDASDAMTGAPLPDRLGIGLGDKTSASRWSLAGHRGGVVAAGVGTALPGKPADLLLLDDLFAGMLAADSPAERRRVNTWWDSVGSQRLGPDAPCICIGTRWNEEDAHAYLLSQEPDRWRVLNFPAIAEPGVHDSLNRPYGVQLENPRGTTDWAARRDVLPARVWASMFQGNPTPSDGALFNPDWFKNHRLPETPALYRRLVGVDPAETGSSDEVGLIAGGLAADGTVVLTDDWSGQFSSAVWPRRACLMALATQAGELVFEAYSAPVAYQRLLEQAFDDLATEAVAGDGTVEAQFGDGTVGRVRVPASRPFLIKPWTRQGNAVVRSSGLRYAMSSGRCRVVGHRLATMEAVAIRWFESQHQPDRVAGATIVYDELAGGGGTALADDTGSWGDMPSGL
ncbi:hypothetical protein [Nocardia farcinica]|uniref:hypothetical protein n=1 Tax=Nocardia farcinica TaxID=37329 RepID=UPI002457D432|nr:hypothetical protein [Nocardia farcinica]